MPHRSIHVHRQGTVQGDQWLHNTLLRNAREERRMRQKWNYRSNHCAQQGIISSLSQRLLHKMTNSRCFDSSSSRSLNVKTSKTQYLASILTDTLVQCIWHNINYAQGKRYLHSRLKFISAFTEFTWPWRRTLTN